MQSDTKIEEKVCQICVEIPKKRNYLIRCSACSKESCYECTKTFILNSQAILCMFCKKIWDENFIFENFPKKFASTTWRDIYKRQLVEKEKLLLPETMKLIKIEKENRQRAEKIAILQQRLREYRRKIKRINERILVLKSEKIEIVNVEYSFPCPVEACKGFVNDKWFCELCNSKICKKCLKAVENDKMQYKNLDKKSIKDHERERETHESKRIGHERKRGDELQTHESKRMSHSCKQEDILSAREVLSTTKPCPKCSARIYKLSGCDQMFCTKCKTAFSWKTGKICQGIIHNPHYYDYIRETGTDLNVNVNDNFYVSVNSLSADYLKTPPLLFNRLLRIRQTVDEINEFVRAVRQNYPTNIDHSQLRIDYLMGDIETEEAFMRKIFIQDKKWRRNIEVVKIFESFLSVTRDVLNELKTEVDCIGIKNKKKIATVPNMIEDTLSRISELSNETNERLGRLHSQLGFSIFSGIDSGGKFDKKISVKNISKVIL